jgi:hypothetical protein
MDGEIRLGHANLRRGIRKNSAAPNRNSCEFRYMVRCSKQKAAAILGRMAGGLM